MKNISLILIFLSGLVFAENVKFYKPSFDCTNVKKNSIEYMICINKRLSNLDTTLGLVYIKLKEIIGSDEKQLIKEQRVFIKDRNKCKEDFCIQHKYENQIDILKALYEIYNVKTEFNTLKNINIENYISAYALPNDKKSSLLVEQLLKVFQEQNIKLESINNSYIFTDSSHRLVAGLYCANADTGVIKRIIGGFPKYWHMLDKNIMNIVVKTGGGSRGTGYEGVTLLKITDCSHITKKMIVEYEYDMVSGFCGREFLNLKHSGNIKSVELNKTNKLIKINVQEQKCPIGKIINKEIEYDLVQEKFKNPGTVATLKKF